MKLPKRHKERARDFIIIMIIIFGLIAGACVIAGWMREDIEAKSIAIFPSDERVYAEPNEPIDSQIAGAMERTEDAN